MFDAIEFRKVTNGYVASVRAQEEETEYVFDSHHKLLRFIKQIVNAEKEKKGG